MKLKIGFLNKLLWSRFTAFLAVFASIVSIFSICVEIPHECKITIGICFIVFLVIVYISMLIWMNYKQKICLYIGATKISVFAGDIFKQTGFKVIAFNEYFDTLVDDIVISSTSLNGQFIKNHVNDIASLNANIEKDPHLSFQKTSLNENRIAGNKQKYKLGSIYKYSDAFLLTALTHFNDNNNAYLDIHSYLDFLFSFWEGLNKCYNAQPVSITVFGSEITRFCDKTEPTLQDLLEIILWTFKLSKIKLVKGLNIVVSDNKVTNINFCKLKEYE